jgi:lipoprotein signal peptidase
MKNSVDFYATMFGAFASFIKARKMKLKLSNLVLQVIIGGALGFLTIGAIDYFFKDASPRIVMLISFVVGWCANEITDLFDHAIKDGYEAIKYRFTKK